MRNNPEHFMNHALCLARRGLGNTAENPSVGCVIVKDGVIVGRGYTQPGGRPHAEVIALAQAGKAAQGAEVFVTLEPCAHQGKSPPCVEALISAQVAKVYVALQDPHHVVNGSGIQRLKDAGIDVEVGICLSEAIFLNQGFLMRIIAGRPLVVAKIATTIDGRVALANGASKWITEAPARMCVQSLRATFDCLLSGIGTVIADNPSFTCRLDGLENRLRLRAICDTMLRIPLDCALVRQARDHRLRIYCQAESAESLHARHLREKGVEIVGVRTLNGSVDMSAVLNHLGSDGINRVMIEAGETLVTSAFRQQLIDRIFLFRGQTLFGGDAQAMLGNLQLEAIAHAPRLHRLAEEDMGNDRFETFLVSYADDE